MTLSRGDRIGQYEIESLIGKGAMGEVYRARDINLNRLVALKVLVPTASRDPSRLTRFKREAQILASLNHPNIAGIYFFVDEDDVRALALEYVEGPTLAERISNGPLPIAESLTIGQQICEGMAAPHVQGIVHRDLKPANVKVSRSGVKVLDFGLSLFAPGPPVDALRALDLPTVTDPNISAVGAVMGTPAYMSPEQAAGRVPDKPSDIWAVGVVLYELLTGERAFPGNHRDQVLEHIKSADPDWSRLPRELPPTIPKALRRCLRRDEHERYQDIRDLRLDILEGLADLLGANRMLDVDLEMVQRVFAWGPPNTCFCRPLICLMVASTVAEALAVLDELERDLATRATLHPENLTAVENALASFVDARLARLRPPGDWSEVQGKVVGCYTSLLKWCAKDTQFAGHWQTAQKWTTPQKGREALRNETVRWLLPRLISALPAGTLRAAAVALLDATIDSGINATTEHERNVVRSALFAVGPIAGIDTKDVVRLLTTGFRTATATGAWRIFHEPWVAAIRDIIQGDRLGDDRHLLHPLISSHVLYIKAQPARDSEYIVLTKIMADLRRQPWRPLNCFTPLHAIDAVLELPTEQVACKVINLRRTPTSAAGAWITSQHAPSQAVDRSIPARLVLKLSPSVILHGRIYWLSTTENPFNSQFGHPCGYRFKFDDGQDDLLGQVPQSGPLT